MPTPRERMMTRIAEHIASKRPIGQWTLIGAGFVRRGHRMVLCVCSCGNERHVPASNLFSGASLRCRKCIGPAISATKRTHGATCGGVVTPEFRIHAGMLNRCSLSKLPEYRYYGARGIRVCERWSGAGGFERFLLDMGARPSPVHSIDRIDSDGHYEPGNCRWATAKEQARNTSGNVCISFEGRTLTAVEWAEETGILYETILHRWARGCAPWEVLFQGHLPKTSRRPTADSAAKSDCSLCKAPLRPMGRRRNVLSFVVTRSDKTSSETLLDTGATCRDCSNAFEKTVRDFAFEPVSAVAS